MADYYTNFSVVIPLPDERAQEHALHIARSGSRGYFDDELPQDFPNELKDSVEDWSFDTEPDTEEGRPALWLHSECGGMDAACGFIHHLLKHFDPEGRVSLEWSHDCSKPLVDAYGGGAAFITAEEIHSFSTAQWLEQQRAEQP